MRTTAVNTKRFRVYTLTLLLCVFYTVVLDARFGLPFTVTMLLAPLISYLFLSLSVRRVSMDMTVSRATVYKGETVDVTLTVRNGSRLPMPFFEARVSAGEHLAQDGDEPPPLAVRPRGSETLTVTYMARMWGTSDVSAAEPVISDFLGFFKITPVFPRLTAAVAVCPSLCESGVNELIAAIQSAAMYSDKGQKETSAAHSAGAEPGYEHRPYEPGDPLKRINWKLSAKRDEWLVRSLEFPGGDLPAVVLDPCRDPAAVRNRAALAVLEEQIVEGFLAMLLSLLRFQMSCEAYCRFGNEWKAFPIEDMEDVEALQRELAAYRFLAGAKTRVPEPLLSGGCPSLTVFSCCPDEALAHADVNVVCAAPPNRFPGRNVWMMNENFDFYAVH